MEAEGLRWWSGETVAVVTGANRGIGLEIARQLADKGLTVIMTARKPPQDPSRSVQQLLQEAERGRKNVIFHTLDIDQEQSVLDFIDWLKLRVGFVDILINNAGVAKPVIDWDFMRNNNVDTRTILMDPAWTDGMWEEYKSAKEVIETNYYGTKRVTKALLPLLRPSSCKPRIVNVTSIYGLLRLLRDEELRKQLQELEDLTEQNIDGVVEMFLEDIQYEKGMEKWPRKVPSYSISKIALNAYMRLLALQLQDKACINCVHPGFVMTDMTFGTGDLSPAEGAEHVVRVALFPTGGPSGHNFLEINDSEF